MWARYFVRDLKPSKFHTKYFSHWKISISYRDHVLKTNCGIAMPHMRHCYATISFKIWRHATVHPLVKSCDIHLRVISDSFKVINLKFHSHLNRGQQVKSPSFSKYSSLWMATSCHVMSLFTSLPIKILSATYRPLFKTVKWSVPKGFWFQAASKIDGFYVPG